MKIVKLNKTHRLYYSGYTHAFRFDSMFSKNYNEIRKSLLEMFGYDSTKWASWASPRRYPYWIGVTDEAYLTVALLKAELRN